MRVTSGSWCGIKRREMAAHVVFIALLASLAWLAGARGWDEAVSAHYFSVRLQAFPLRDAWLFKSLLHDIGKQVPLIVAVLLLCMRVHGHFARSQWHEWRHDVLYALAVLAVSTAIAGALKGTAPIYCPWSLEEYGGGMAHYSLAGWLAGQIPPDARAGHCWPSGHAAGAFGLIGLYFMARARRHQAAVPLLALVVAWGAVCGWAQIARGAHFVSHVLWSCVLCWMISLSLLPLLSLSRQPAREESPLVAE